MNVREQFHAIMDGAPVDGMPVLEWAYWWDKTLDGWYGECCFSKRMRKLFIKNEKSVLRFCNKSSKTKRAFTKVLMPCKRPF